MSALDDRNTTATTSRALVLGWRKLAYAVTSRSRYFRPARAKLGMVETLQPTRMMRRKPIHPEVPFTEAEHAAAWILLGIAAEDAIRDAALLAVELPKSLEEADDARVGSDAASMRLSRVQFVGSFAPVIHLAADISSGGTLLSETAREAWLERWDLRVDAAEVEQRVAQLDRLGPEWSTRRSVFYRLLTAGTL